MNTNNGWDTKEIYDSRVRMFGALVLRILESDVPWDLNTLNNIAHGATGYLGLATIDENGDFKRKDLVPQE
jgi:hypothetical protein